MPSMCHSINRLMQLVSTATNLQRDTAVSLLPKLGKCTLTHLHLHLFPPLLPFPLSASFISSHCLPHCLSVFPCCYFRNHRRVFRSHVVSSPGKVWIMQTSLITPCANPLDWKSMCTQVASKWLGLSRPREGEEERVPLRFNSISILTGSWASPNTMCFICKRRCVLSHRGPNVIRKRLVGQKKRILVGDNA